MQFQSNIKQGRSFLFCFVCECVLGDGKLEQSYLKRDETLNLQVYKATTLLPNFLRLYIQNLELHHLLYTFLRLYIQNLELHHPLYTVHSIV